MRLVGRQNERSATRQPSGRPVDLSSPLRYMPVCERESVHVREYIHRGKRSIDQMKGGSQVHLREQWCRWNGTIRYTHGKGSRVLAKNDAGNSASNKSNSFSNVNESVSSRPRRNAEHITHTRMETYCNIHTYLHERTFNVCMLS